MKRNLFDDIPIGAPEEIFEVLRAAENVKVERIVSNGHASPDGFWYDQESHEWVVLLRGRAGLEIEDGAGKVATVELGPGDWVDIPAHRRHRVAWTADDAPTVWLAVHY